MNVYDFDKTIYDGDSTLDFYFFCLKRNPIIIIYIFKQLYGIVLNIFKIIDITKMKSYFFCFLPKINNLEFMVEEFWIKHEKKIKKWYLKKRKKTDLVISASPTFLLKPICNKLEIMVPIATEINLKTGKLIGENCKGEEKVKRYKRLYGKQKILKFYSDSVSDLPLKKISQKSFLVKKNKIKLWQ